MNNINQCVNGLIYFLIISILFCTSSCNSRKENVQVDNSFLFGYWSEKDGDIFYILNDTTAIYYDKIEPTSEHKYKYNQYEIRCTIKVEDKTNRRWISFISPYGKDESFYYDTSNNFLRVSGYNLLTDNEYFSKSYNIKPSDFDEMTDNEFSRHEHLENGYNISWLWGVWEGTYSTGINSFSLYVYFKHSNDSIFRSVKLRDSDAIVYFNNNKGEYFEGNYWFNDEYSVLTLWSGDGYKYELPIDFEGKNINGFKRIGNSSSEMIAKTQLREKERIDNIHKENRRLAEIERQNNPQMSKPSNQNTSTRIFRNETDVMDFLNNRVFISSDWTFTYQISNNTVYFDDGAIGSLVIRSINHKLQIVDFQVNSPYRTTPIAFLLIGNNIIKDQEGRIYRYGSY